MQAASWKGTEAGNMPSACSALPSSLCSSWKIGVGGCLLSSLSVLLQNTECSRTHSFQASGTGVVSGSQGLVVERVSGQQLPKLPTGGRTHWL